MFNTQPLNTEKFKELLLYISHKNRDNPNFGAVVLNKILYYCDFGYYAFTGKSITGETYIRKERGAVPKHLLGIREQLVKEGKLKIETINRFGNDQIRTVPIEDSPTFDALSDKEQQFADLIIERIKPMTAQTISEIAHRELSWNILSNGEEVPYCTIFLRHAHVNPIPKDAMIWAREVIKNRRLAEIAV